MSVPYSTPLPTPHTRSPTHPHPLSRTPHPSLVSCSRIYRWPKLRVKRWWVLTLTSVNERPLPYPLYQHPPPPPTHTHTHPALAPPPPPPETEGEKVVGTDTYQSERASLTLPYPSTNPPPPPPFSRFPHLVQLTA